jgi:hypothetical protein
LLAEALAFFGHWRDRTRVAECLEILAAMAAQDGQAVRAARFVGAATAIRETADAPLLREERDKLERELASARAALGPDGFPAAAAEGRAMTVDQAVDHALAWTRARTGVIRAAEGR